MLTPTHTHKNTPARTQPLLVMATEEKKRSDEGARKAGAFFFFSLSRSSLLCFAARGRLEARQLTAPEHPRQGRIPTAHPPTAFPPTLARLSLHPRPRKSRKWLPPKRAARLRPTAPPQSRPCPAPPPPQVSITPPTAPWSCIWSESWREEGGERREKRANGGAMRSLSLDDPRDLLSFSLHFAASSSPSSAAPPRPPPPTSLRVATGPAP